MGNNNSQTTTTDFVSQQYRQIRRQKNGIILSHLDTNQTYFLREMNYANKTDYENEKQRLIDQIKKEQNQNILKVVKVWGNQYNNFCSNSYKVFSVYQFPQITLYDQIIARRKENRYFEECDLWSILQSCCNALVDLNTSISLQPSKIFILSDGLLKVINNDMANYQYRYVINEQSYYAPQKITNFNKPDRINTLQKQAIFSMGMTILQAALLNEVKQCYDYKNLIFLQQKLQQMIEMLYERYSEEFIDALATILQQNVNRRPSLIQIQDILNEKWNKQQQYMVQQQQQLKGSQYDHQPQQIVQKQTYRQTYINTSIKNSLKMPLQQINNKQLKFDNNYDKYSINNEILTKQNLFTDPKLLEMIRKDLENIDTMKKKHQMQFMEYPNYNQQGYYSSKQSIEQIYNVNKSNNVQENFEENKLKSIKNGEEIIRETYEDQSYYEGTKLNGKKHGKGKMVYQDGAYYEGQFDNDQMHGNGTLYYRQDYPAYDGQWQQDHFNGYGILFNQTPIQLVEPFNFEDFNYVEDYWVKYQGNFVFDNKNGFGKLILSNGQVFNGQFQKDYINGQGQFLNMQGQLIRGIWKNNVLVQHDQQ